MNKVIRWIRLPKCADGSFRLNDEFSNERNLCHSDIARGGGVAVFFAGQHTPMTLEFFAGLLLSASAFSIIMGLLFWQRLRTRAAFTAFILFSAGALWMSSYAGELLLPGLQLKVLANKIQYLGIAILLAGLVVFVLQVLNETRWLTRRNIILLSSVYAVLLVFIFTNEYHGLMWPYHYLEHEPNGVVLLHHPHGIVYWIFVLYGELMMVIATTLIIRTALQTRHLFRRQAIVLLVGMAFPWAFHLADLFGFSISEPYNPAPLSFIGGITFIAFGLWRLQMGSILPVARNTILETIADAVVVFDAYGHMIDVNPAGEKLLRATGFTGRLVGTELARLGEPWISLAHPDGASSRREIVLKYPDGERVYDVHHSELKAILGGVGHVLVLRDITVQTRAAEQLKASLSEKEVLLKEIHHRVKNNLQIISSLLFLQSRKSEDETVRQSLTESQNRVRSMALVHEQLYQSADLAQIDFAQYTRRLVENLGGAFGAAQRGIKTTIVATDIYFGIDTAIPCGLILNELVSNAFKYAFPSGDGGHIAITIEPIDNDKIRLQVEDTGIGFPSDVDIEHTGSLGIRLVTSLTRQLNGNIEFSSAGGARVTIEFPKK